MKVYTFEVNGGPANGAYLDPEQAAMGAAEYVRSYLKGRVPDIGKAFVDKGYDGYEVTVKVMFRPLNVLDADGEDRDDRLDEAGEEGDEEDE